MTEPSVIHPVPFRIKFRSSNFWLRAAVIVGLFLISLFLAVRAGKTMLPFDILTDPVLLLFPAVIGVVVLLRNPGIGLLVLVMASMAIKFAVGTGTQSRLNSAVLVLGLLIGLWVFDMLSNRKRIQLAPSRTNAPILLLVLFAILAFLVGQLPWFVFARNASLTAQLGGLAIFALSAGAYLWVGNQIRNIRFLEWMTWLFLALGSVSVLGYVVPPIGPYIENVIQKGVYTNSMFWLWLIVMSFSQAVFNRSLHLFWRLVLFGLFLGGLYSTLIVDSGWTSGWLPAVLGVAVAIWVSGSAWAWISIVVGGLASLLKIQSIQSLVFGGGNEYSVVTRLEAWRVLGQIVKFNPILGLGPANYYYYTPLYSILGYTVKFNSHNNYVDLIAQTGVLGLAAFLWFSGEVAYLGWRLRSLAPEGFARAYVFGALGGLVGMLVSGMLGDWVLPFIYNIGMTGFRGSLLGWLFLGGLLAIEQIIRNEQNTELVE